MLDRLEGGEFTLADMAQAFSMRKGTIASLMSRGRLGLGDAGVARRGSKRRLDIRDCSIVFLAHVLNSNMKILDACRIASEYMLAAQSRGEFPMFSVWKSEQGWQWSAIGMARPGVFLHVNATKVIAEATARLTGLNDAK